MKKIAMKVSLVFLLSILCACTGSEIKSFSLNHQQILKHLRMANEVAKKSVESGYYPFGAVLVAPDGETVLMKQENLGTIGHAETELSRFCLTTSNYRDIV